MVYAIVTEHRGEIELDAGASVGARFVVRLPLGLATDIEPGATAVLDSNERRVARVVLINSDGREATRSVEALADAGLDIRHAATLAGAEAVTNEWDPDAVVAVTTVPDGDVVPWIVRRGLPAVVLVASTDEVVAPPTAVVLERRAAPEAVLAALQRLGVPVVSR